MRLDSLQSGHNVGRVELDTVGSAWRAVMCTIGGRTPVGTLVVGVGKATGPWAFYITLGTPAGSGSTLDQPLFR